MENSKEDRDAIKCFEEAIRKNPNHAKAWYNKGITLGKIKRNDESIECLEKAIEINPNFPEAHRDLGIVFLNVNEYSKSLKFFEKARALFSDADEETDTYEEWAYNIPSLLSKLKKIDDNFIDALNSNDLSDLKKEMGINLKEIINLLKEFEDKIPLKAKNIIINKLVCFSTISKTLSFNKINARKLSNMKERFEKQNFYGFAIAFELLKIFMERIFEYKDLAHIPVNDSKFLLKILNNLNVLNGKLTEEITNIEYEIKSTGMEMGSEAAKLTIKEDNLKVNNISISNIKKDNLRVCLVQLEYDITETFPYELKDEVIVKEKILKALEVAVQNKVDIICFPELSFSKEFINDVKTYENIIVICGSYYEGEFNKCVVIIDKKEHPVYKINPAPNLETRIAPGTGMKSGNDIKIFKTEDEKFKFVVLICMDYLTESRKICDENDVDFIFNPSYNPDPDRSQRRANSDCEDYHVNLIQVNRTEKEDKYGKSCIIGIEHKDNINRLITGGYRPKDGVFYKLCEANEEMMIIADLTKEGLEIPTPLRATPRIEIINLYTYEDESWNEYTPK